MNRLGDGIDKDADSHAARLQAGHDRREPRRIRTRAPACLAGDFAGDDRHQRALIGADPLDERDEIVTRIALDIEFDLRPLAFERLRDVIDVLGNDMTAISARMHGDPVNPGAKTHGDGIKHARLVATPRVPQSRHLIDVHRQSNHETY